MKTLKDVSLSGQRVLLRFDGDVPVSDEGVITDDYRLQAVLPSVTYCLEQGAKVVLLAHRGRPEGKEVPDLSSKVLVDYLSKALGKDVVFAPHFTDVLPDAPVVLWENLRFHKGEEENDENFARVLAKQGTIYCNDAFAVSHRAHASVVALAGLLPHVAGFQMIKEIEQLTPLRNNAEEPYALVLGGAKASDKSPIIADVIDRADTILIGGLVAVTYLAAMGNPVGGHTTKADEVTFAQECIRKMNEAQVTLCVPVDYINQEKEIKDITAFGPNDLMLDIGPKTWALYAQELDKANTIFWNGAMGKNEDPTYAQGTIEVGRAILKSGAEVRVGSGGDTVGAIRSHKLEQAFTFISTGGGATLEFIAGRDLPGIKALES